LHTSYDIAYWNLLCLCNETKHQNFATKIPQKEKQKGINFNVKE